MKSFGIAWTIFVVGLMGTGVMATFQNMTRTFFNLGGGLRCGGSSLLQNIEMSNPVNIPTNEPCTYWIRANGPRVCQLRIDFDTVLAPPRNTAERPYAHCVDDAIEIDNFRISLCGNNVRQHVYVPWAGRSTGRFRQITVRIANRAQNAGLPQPKWSIRVTQLKCEGPIFGRDHQLLAPTGCDQYFTEPQGVVSSFNFNEAQGLYPGNLDYSICFRRLAQHTKLSINPIFFSMSKNVADGAGYEADCVPQIVTVGARRDFLSLPGASFQNADNANLVVNRFCGTGIVAKRILTVESPGPFTMQFSTDEQSSDVEQGFRLEYTLE